MQTNSSNSLLHRPGARVALLGAAATLLAALLPFVCLGVPHADASGAHRAAAARVISVNDTAHLHPAHGAEEGRGSGSLPGNVRVIFALSATTVKATFTFYVSGGSISGHGSANLHLGHGGYVSFGGSLVVNHGTGRYAHASGSGRLYGTINRANNNATVQTVGQLHY